MVRRKNQWVVMDGDHALDIRTPDGLIATAETPDGWIRPVRVLSVKASEPAATHAVVTVLQPRTGTMPSPDAQVEQTSDRITVTIGSTRVEWRNAADGWQIAGAPRERD
jgi:hypothetical protein